VEDALAHHGKPEFFKTAQGSRLPGEAFTALLLGSEIAIRMDNKEVGGTTCLSRGGSSRLSPLSHAMKNM